MSSEYWKRREETTAQCRELVQRIMGRDERFTVKEDDVRGLPQTPELPASCVVDFKRKRFEADVDCEERCTEIVGEEDSNGDEEEVEGKVDYDDCVERCESAKESAETGSVKTLLDGTILESTLPGRCDAVWGSEGSNIEDLESKKRAVKRAFAEVGCIMPQEFHDWVHPHEIASGYEVDEDPALCYFHPHSSKAGKCLLKDVLNVMEKKV